MATQDRVTLIIEGLPEDGGRVRFTTFMSQLQSLSATLSRLDRDAGDGKAASFFEIAELSYSSPIRVVLEARAIQGRPYIDGAVVQGLSRLTAALSNGNDLTKVDADLLDDIRKIARPVGKQVKSAALVIDGAAFDLNERVSAKIDEALAVDEECDGSLDGMLEQINVHLGANVFHIYPVIGPKRVTCSFPARLYDEAVAAVGKKVDVFGKLRYRSGANFPHQIAVESIEIFPPEYEMPEWDNIRGLAPDATGALSSEAFVRDLRDAW